jgi:hypothetical protein
MLASEVKLLANLIAESGVKPPLSHPETLCSDIMKKAQSERLKLSATGHATWWKMTTPAARPAPSGPPQARKRSPALRVRQ